MLQPNASPVLHKNSTARRLTTGSVPGMPKQIGQVSVFGSAPNWLRQPQNILLTVDSSTCTSKPMTASYADDRSASCCAGALVPVAIKPPSPGGPACA